MEITVLYRYKQFLKQYFESTVACRNQASVNSVDSAWTDSKVVTMDHPLTPVLPLNYNKPCSFLKHTNHYWGYESSWYWILLDPVCYIWEKCVYAHLSTYTPLHSRSTKQREQQSAVVEPNRAYKQHHKSSLSSSHSVQSRFGLSHLRLTQDTARQPLTVLAAEVTSTLWLYVWKLFFCSAQIIAVHPLTSNQAKKTTRTRHVYFLESCFLATATAPLFQHTSYFYIYFFYYSPLCNKTFLDDRGCWKDLFWKCESG